MPRIVCLANSKKGAQRCIAGMDVDTKLWVRPIRRAGQKGSIDMITRSINGKEPQLLDVLKIPLQQDGNDYGCQPENRWLAEGPWRKIKSPCR